MADTQKPKLDLASKVLPAPLLEALVHIFSQEIFDCALAGGTALAGFYAGHRRSDDLDLFCKSAPAFQATVLACKSLQERGAKILEHRQSAQYFHGLFSFKRHEFTVDVVLDAHIFSATSLEKLKNKIVLFSYESILKTKIATLISRCGEKDLYDLLWFAGENEIDYGRWLEMGREIDSGVSAESVLLSLSGATLRASACGFVKERKEADVLDEIETFRKKLIIGFSAWIKAQGPESDMAKALRQLKKL